MANLVISAGNVIMGANANVDRSKVAGESIVSGNVVYLSSVSPNNNKWLLADNNAVVVEARRPIGIALNQCAANQPLAVLTAGDITLGPVLTAGTDYYLSDTPGAICPQADLATAGENVCFLGLAKSTTVLGVNIIVPGVTV
jgi:hypothetical protein